MIHEILSLPPHQAEKFEKLLKIQFLQKKKNWREDNMKHIILPNYYTFFENPTRYLLKESIFGKTQISIMIPAAINFPLTSLLILNDHIYSSILLCCQTPEAFWRLNQFMGNLAQVTGKNSCARVLLRKHFMFFHKMLL